MLYTCTNKLDSPKENPFASYSFDPNNIENSLDSNGNKSIEQVQTQSIIPNGKSNSNYFAESSRVAQSFRTPGNRRKSTAVSSRISSASILQQKAAELQQQHPQMIAPRFHSGYPTENGMRINQYERFFETDYLNDPGMMSQNTYFHDRPGTSAGSIMQRSFSMEPSNRTPAPYNMRYSHNVGIPQNNSFMRGPTTANRMATPSFTQRPVSRMNVNNFDQNMMYRANAHPYQTYDFQSENELQFQMHGITYPGYHHGMSQQQLYGNNPMNVPFYPGFDPRAHQVDYSTTEAFYEHALGSRSTSDHSSYGVGGMSSSEFQACSFGNRNSHTQTATRSGAGYANVHPYQHDPPHHQQQACIPMNPYKSNRQQRQPYYQGDGMTNNECPPMQEVVVQNTSVRSGIAGDDASRFDDAFL